MTGVSLDTQQPLIAQLRSILQVLDHDDVGLAHAIAPYLPLRRTLLAEREATTHRFTIAGHEGYITVGVFTDQTPGEVFITMSKEGSTIRGLMDTIATMLSLMLQYGVPLEKIVTKFRHTRFEPAGFTQGRSEITEATSIVDYVMHYLQVRFLPDLESPGPEAPL